MQALTSIALAVISGLTAAFYGDLTSPVHPRALPNAPNGYTPTKENCPSTRPSIRSAAQLSQAELDWLPLRRNATLSAMKDFFGHVTVDNFDVVSYLNDHSKNASALPNVALAISGGGYRAMTNGAGAIKAFDSRTENSTSAGQLGGLLQSCTYVAGLSGGSWLLGSIYMNNFTTIANLQTEQPGTVWELGNSIFEGPSDSGNFDILDAASYFTDLVSAVNGKYHAGYPVSLTDYWGRALSYQMINASEGGVDYTWSSIALSANFQNGSIPMPLVVADGRNPGETIIGPNSTNFEYNPFEFGSFDPTVYAFAPLEYLGSRFNSGVLPANESCVRGYDNAGFVYGTSSSLFNELLGDINSTGVPTILKGAITEVLGGLDKSDMDIAAYINPFYNYRQDSRIFSDSQILNLVDGGEDNQNVPLQPLIQPVRHVDVIFAVDTSADVNNWPNGSSLVTTYERSLNSSGIANGTTFPSIPDTQTFVNLGLNTHPTFFGCNTSNMTGPSPLVVYLPEYPYTTYANLSTFQLTWNNSLRDAAIANGVAVVTQANSTLDKNWPACVGCAILSRSLERTNTPVPDICNQCFQTYCWNGTLDSNPGPSYYPTARLPPVNQTSTSMASSMEMVLSQTLMGFCTMVAIWFMS